MRLGSCSSIKRSRSITTSAVTNSCAAGRSGVKLASMALALHPWVRRLVDGDGSGGDGDDPLLSYVDGGLHPMQKRLRINSHENDQRQDRRQNNSFPSA